MYLVQNQRFTAGFVKFIRKRDDFPFGEIEIIQVDIQTGFIVQKLFFHNVNQEGCFSHAAESFDPDHPVVPVNFIQKFPPDGLSGLIQQSVVNIDQILHELNFTHQI